MTEEDRISALPNDVLCRILSFLPTQEAIATSLLSQRWRSLWLSVSALHFDDRIFLQRDDNKPYSSFVEFVSTVILALGFHQSIKTFRLKCVACKGSRLPHFGFKIWVDAAVQRGLENLHVEVRTFYALEVPHSLLSCVTLVHLEFKGLLVEREDFSNVKLPSLKTLHLRNFSMPHPRYLVDFLNGCPILEDLILSGTFDFVSEDNLPAEKLKSLHNLVKANMMSYIGSEILPKESSNLDHVIPVFPNLIHLEFNFRYLVDNWLLVFEMLKRCPKLQSFVLRLNERYYGSWREKFCPCPQFVPECISSHLRKCTIVNYGGNEMAMELQFAKYVMQNSSTLRKLTIYSLPSSNPQMLQELATCPRSSAACELLFK